MKSISMKTGKSALLENWRSGPIGDLALEPGHDRPVLHRFCFGLIMILIANIRSTA